MPAGLVRSKNCPAASSRKLHQEPATGHAGKWKGLYSCDFCCSEFNLADLGNAGWPEPFPIVDHRSLSPQSSGRRRLFRRWNGDNMSRYQQGSLFKLERKSRPDVWVFRWYDNSSGSRKYKKEIIGSVIELRNRREAERSVTALRSSINADVGTPRCVCDLAARYRLHELTVEKKAFSTIEGHRFLFERYIEPRWGHYRLGAVRTIQVEEWLDPLVLAPRSKAKLKSILSTLYNHAIRYEWLTFNPISRVRTTSKRLHDKDVLTPEEFQRLAEQLSVSRWLRNRCVTPVAGLRSTFTRAPYPSRSGMPAIELSQ